jgi:hypothetical protein
VEGAVRGETLVGEEVERCFLNFHSAYDGLLKIIPIFFKAGRKLLRSNLNFPVNQTEKGMILR